MAPKYVAPAIDLKSFSCPHCGALADQAWFDTYASATDEGSPPRIWTATKVADVEKRIATIRTEEGREAAAATFSRIRQLAQGRPVLERRKDSKYAGWDLDNISVSLCYSCRDITIWKHDIILYPPTRYEIEPNPDLSNDIRADFDEARNILDLSPRSAAALLRLCIQKLCKYLGEPGENLNKDIGSLVSKGLSPRVQKALDIVRVVGNNAVHPGELDLRDDRDTAARLFELVNRIAFDMITHPKEVDALFNEKVPQGAKDQIAKRDGQAGA